MNKDELKSILEQHRLWVEGNGGKRADLRDADLQGTELRGADLQEADLREADLQEADLRWASLQEADLRGANLRVADLDFSCFPLWCGSAGIRVDKRLFCQLAAHLCALDVGDEDCRKAQIALLPLAKQSHRAGDLGEWFVKEDEDKATAPRGQKEGWNMLELEKGPRCRVEGAQR